MANANDSDAVHLGHGAPHRVAATRYLDRNWTLVHEIADDDRHSRLALVDRSGASEPVCCACDDFPVAEDDWGFSVDDVFRFVHYVVARVREA